MKTGNRGLEDQCILLCSRRVVTDENLSKLRHLLNLRLKWEYVLYRSAEDGVSGLVYNTLRFLRSDGVVPARVMNALRNGYYQNIINGENYRKELSEVLHTFETEGIHVVLLKGIILSDTIYQNPGLRSYSDVDILIKDYDKEKVIEIISSMGYGQVRGYPDLLVNGSFCFDIHTDLIGASRIKSRQFGSRMSIESIWDNSLSIGYGDSMVRVLSPYDEILYLAFHALKHSYSKLIWLVDIVEITESIGAEMDWQKLKSGAERVNLVRPLYFAFYFIKNLLNAGIHEKVMAELTPSKLNVLEKRISNVILSRGKVSHCCELIYLSLIKGTRYKLIFLWESIFPKPSIRKQLIPENKLRKCFFYPIRTARILYMLSRFIWSLFSVKCFKYDS